MLQCTPDGLPSITDGRPDEVKKGAAAIVHQRRRRRHELSQHERPRIPAVGTQLNVDFRIVKNKAPSFFDLFVNDMCTGEKAL